MARQTWSCEGQIIRMSVGLSVIMYLRSPFVKYYDYRGCMCTYVIGEPGHDATRSGTN